MNINFNGVDINPEEFIKMQEQAELQQLEAWNNARKQFDCNCAIINRYQNGFIVTCSLTRETIVSPEYCRECSAYNNIDYSIIKGSDE